MRSTITRRALMAGALSAIPALSAITVAEIETEEDYLPFRIMREWERRNPMPSVDEIATDDETGWSLRLFDYPGKNPNRSVTFTELDQELSDLPRLSHAFLDRLIEACNWSSRRSLARRQCGYDRLFRLAI